MLAFEDAYLLRDSLVRRARYRAGWLSYLSPDLATPFLAAAAHHRSAIFERSRSRQAAPMHSSCPKSLAQGKPLDKII